MIRLSNNFEQEQLDGEVASNSFPSLVEYFGAIGPLSEAELTLLRELASDAHYHPPHRDLWPAYKRPPAPRLLCAGWACRYRTLANGRRQIICILLPGDFIGPVLEPRLPSFCAIAPLTEVEAVNAKPLADAAMASEPVYPTLARAARLATHLQDALLCEQIARLGQQNAGERFAHLMLELHYRLGLIGQASGNHFALPLTQDVLADALGLSAVHLNRTLKQLRRDGLLKLESGRLTLLQPEVLRSMAGWTVPRYPGSELRRSENGDIKSADTGRNASATGSAEQH